MHSFLCYKFALEIIIMKKCNYKYASGKCIVVRVYLSLQGEVFLAAIPGKERVMI